MITQAFDHFARHALDCANEGITIVDMKDEKQPLIYVNQAFIELTGYKREEIIGQNCRFLQGTLKDQPELTFIRDAVSKEQNCRFILQNMKKNGELFYNELSLAPL